MFPDFLPSFVTQLTDVGAIALAKRIKRCSIEITDKISIETSFVASGTGETPIVLLHGFDSSVLEFRRLVPHLVSDQTRVIAVDLLGFGFTQRSKLIKITPDNIKTHLYEFWRTVIQESCILVGASMGGAVAIDFALTYPDCVSKLVLIDSAGLSSGLKVGKYLFPPLGFLATEFLRNPRVRLKISEQAYYNLSLATREAELCAALHLKMPNWRDSMISFTKSGGYGSFANQLSQIKVLTLIIWGEYDKILGTKDANRFKELIPNSELIWIKDAGHVPHLEKPEATANYIISSC